jgi:lipid II:glycine glycyltransferase (peptidoglycan interpeptide bridge formation enzyme)
VEIISEENIPELEEFISSHPKGHFMQSSRWALQKPDWSWVAIAKRNEHGRIIGSLSLLVRKVPKLPYTLMYACRGPVCDTGDAETLSHLLAGAKRLARTFRSYAVKLDPDVLTENAEFVNTLETLGFKRVGEGKNFEGAQPRFVFRLNVEGKTEAEMLEFFSSKTRYNIRLAARKGVEVRIDNEKGLDAFAALMVETGLRDGFVTRPKKYFEAMLKNLGEDARLYMAYYKDIPVAGTLAIRYGDKVWYLYGASSNEHRELMPNYLLQWEMIKWAINSGCRLYDFRGVSGDLSEDNPLYGLYRFKKGFNGDFCEFIGEFDYVLSPLLYKAADVAGNYMKRRMSRKYKKNNG